MLPCVSMSVAPLLFVVLAACHDLSAVPIVAGEHCAPARDEDVACTLDGDTFQVGTCGGESVRLLGVAAPEIAHNASEVDECWGPEAAAWLTDRLAGQTVRLEFDAVCTDTYERTLAYAWILEDDGTEVLLNEEIVAEGQARVYADFDDIRLRDKLYAAQAAAVSANKGLWAVCE
jgi:micrococcal nuclease